MNLKITLQYFFMAFLAVFTFASCESNGGPDDDLVNGPDLEVYGVTANNELVLFNASVPYQFHARTAITGIPSGERVISIDFRPATGELYGLTSASHIYVINIHDASARAIGSSAFSPGIAGDFASIDFNPTVDRIRLVSNTGQNLRLHPETGALVEEDGTISGGGSPSISGVAYTNSFAGAETTVLYDIDATTGTLFRQDPPNDGVLVEIGSLGISFSGSVGFDISADNSAALVSTSYQNASELFWIDLNTGRANKIGNLGGEIIDLAIPTHPVAYAVDGNNNLHIFNPDRPTSTVVKAISGLASGETILGIDFRPVNGQLYALGSSSHLYTINLSSGEATAVGTTALSPGLQGTHFGFDFNPTVDRIRIISNTGQNLRVHPEEGSVTVDGSLNPGSPNASAAAYSNNFAGSTSTVMYVIDHETNALYRQDPPNDGTLVHIGTLGQDITSANGFDIGSQSDRAYFIGTVDGQTRLFSIDLSNGAATAVSDFPSEVNGFAIGLGF